MKRYFLNTLIFFLKTQQDIHFKGIEQVLRIIDHKRYSDAKKQELIIDTLRYYGLNETDYRNGEFGFGESIPLPETPTNNVEDIIQLVTQTFHLKLLNGVLELAVAVN
jgi:hypothetical protein